MNNKKMKNPTYTYIKEFDTFEEGYSELISLIPQIEYYGGDESNYEDVVRCMTELINHNLPSPLNSQFPNTLSFSISSKEVGFLTDDYMAFGWKIFINRNDGSLVYQFRVTFITLSMSKRKYVEALTNNRWKERDLSEKQSRFWNESSGNQRPIIKDERHTSNKRNYVPKRPANGASVPPKERGNRDTAHSNSNNNAQVPSREVLEVVPESPRQEKEEQIVVKEEVAVAPEPVEEEVTKPIIAKPAPVTKKKHKLVPSSFAKQNQQIRIEQGTDEKTLELNRLRTQASCSITKGETPAIFTVTHKGTTRTININDHNEGVLLDRSAHQLMIENVVYNYETCQVIVLDEEYKPETATQLGCSNGSNLFLPDTAFVGKKAADQFMEDKGMISSSSEVIIPGKTNVANTPKPLVLNNKPVFNEAPKYRPGEQMVRMSNVGGPNL